MRGALMSLALTGGDWVIWILAAASVAAFAAALDRFRLLRAESRALASLRPAWVSALDKSDLPAAGRALSAHPGAAARVLSEALAAAPSGAEAVSGRLEAALSDERRFLEKRLLWLGTLGNNAPFVGLFGTVLGVIKAFSDLAQSGAGPEVAMAGLSAALIATAAGLLVAIPCVLAFNALQKSARDILDETQALGRRIRAR